MEATAPAAGWFDDPHGSGQLRWWDGAQWTEHVTPNPAAPVQAAPAVAQAPAMPVQAEPQFQAQPVAEALPEAKITPMPTSSRGGALADRFGSIPPRTLAIVGGVLVLLVALVFVGPKVFGGGGPSGPPLTAEEYAAKIKEFSASADQAADIDKDATPEQLKEAAGMMREFNGKLKGLNPPESVATEHTTLTGQIDQLADGIEKMAANPKDQATAMELFGQIMGMGATIQSMEKKLGVSLSEETTTPVTSG